MQAGGSASGSVALAGWASALSDGLAAVSKYGNATRGSRTMLDALLPALDALDGAAQDGAWCMRARARPGGRRGMVG